MARQTTDRSIPRARAMLQQALKSLVLEKDYETITVNEICEAANVGRSTFYAHYRSKDDLKRRGLEKLREHIFDRQREASASGTNGQRALSFSLPMFEHARDHREHYRALIGGRGGAVALDSIRRILSDLVRAELSATVHAKSAAEIPRELVVQYVVGACMAVLTWWLDGGAKLPPDRVDAIFQRLTTQGPFA